MTTNKKRPMIVGVIDERNQDRSGWHESVQRDTPRVIVCGDKYSYMTQRGDSTDGFTCWEKANEPSSGFLLTRWKGLDIDYGGVIKAVKLPDGTEAAFVHDRSAEPWSLLNGATWWSIAKMPEWLQKLGVKYPDNKWIRNRIVEDSGGPEQCVFGGDWSDKWPEWWEPLA